MTRWLSKHDCIRGAPCINRSGDQHTLDLSCEGCQQDIIITQTDPASQRQLARYRGWRIKVLEVLQNSGGLSVAQITEKLNHRRPDIRVYCERLYKDGFIEPIERWGWKITPAGLLLLYIQPDNTNTTTTQHQHNTKTTVRQLTLAPYINLGYSEPENVIINTLIKHYNDTGQPFIFIEDESDLIEIIGLPPDILGAAMRKLYQDRVCYIYNNRKYGRQQLRLYEDFMERIKHV